MLQSNLFKYLSGYVINLCPANMSENVMKHTGAAIWASDPRNVSKPSSSTVQVYANWKGISTLLHHYIKFVAILFSKL